MNEEDVFYFLQMWRQSPEQLRAKATASNSPLLRCFATVGEYPDWPALGQAMIDAKIPEWQKRIAEIMELDAQRTKEKLAAEYKAKGYTMFEGLGPA